MVKAFIFGHDWVRVSSSQMSSPLGSLLGFSQTTHRDFSGFPVTALPALLSVVFVCDVTTSPLD